MEVSDTEISADREFTRLGQIAYDDDLLLVLDGGDYVNDRIPRNAIKSARLETRPSFKHPVIGIIMGSVLIGVPVSAFLGDPLGIEGLILCGIETMIIAGFLVLLGLYLYFPALSNRKIVWLIIDTTHGERTFPLQGEITDEFVEFTMGLGTKKQLLITPSNVRPLPPR